MPSAHSTATSASAVEPPTASANGAAPRTRLGSWIKFPSTLSVEILFDAGADFVCIDMCNGWLSVDRVAELLAFSAATGPRLVRLPADASPSLVGQLLDAGADGVVIPHITRLDHAQAMVAAAYFPPEGNRGRGSTGRAGKWGLADAGQYLATGRREGRPPYISLMVETIEALGLVDALARIDGVSELLIGTADLTAELDSDLVRLSTAADDVVRSCARNGVTPAIAVARVREVPSLAQRGFAACYVSNDLTLLALSATQCFVQGREDLADHHPRWPVGHGAAAGLPPRTA